jgi:hypothetical protein
MDSRESEYGVRQRQRTAKFVLIRYDIKNFQIIQRRKQLREPTLNSKSQLKETSGHLFGLSL